LAIGPEIREASARPSQTVLESERILRAAQWHAPNNIRLTVARRRRIFTVFPYAESPVIVDGDSMVEIAACEGPQSLREIRALTSMQTQ
jgi:hypothetical protein